MNEKFIVQKLLEHDDKLDQMVTKSDFAEFKDKMLTGMDRLASAVERLDGERLFQIHRLDRHEEDIDKIKTKIELNS